MRSPPSPWVTVARGSENERKEENTRQGKEEVKRVGQGHSQHKFLALYTRKVMMGEKMLIFRNETKFKISLNFPTTFRLQASSQPTM